MTVFKKIFAGIVSIAMVLSFAGCHSKGEVAASYDKYQIPSGVYLSLLLQADSEGRQKVSEAFESAGKDTDDIDYYDQTLDDKDFSDWVVDRTKDLCRRYFMISKLFDEYSLKLSDSDSQEISQYTDLYWSYYGYSEYFEPNGVSKESYKKSMETLNYKYGALFEYLYTGEGPNAISKDTLKKALAEHYAIANMISESFTDSDGNELTDDEKDALYKKLSGYADDINNGKKTFEKLYKELNPSDDTSSAATSSADTEESKPKDELATLFGDEDTNNQYASYFSEVKKQEQGKAVVLKFDDCYMLVVKKDISADPYYLDTLSLSLSYLLKQDEFDEMLEEKGAKLDIDFNNSAIKYLKPKNIEIPETTNG